MRNLMFVLLGAMACRVCGMLWELSDAWITVGHGLHPMLCGALAMLLVVCVFGIAHTWRD